MCTCIYVFLLTPQFSLGSKFIIPKITIFGDLGLESPHLKAKMVKFGVRVRTWELLTVPNFVKIA